MEPKLVDIDLKKINVIKSEKVPKTNIFNIIGIIVILICIFLLYERYKFK